MRFIREAGAEITARNYTATDTLLDVSVRLDDEKRPYAKDFQKFLTLHFINEN